MSEWDETGLKNKLKIEESGVEIDEKYRGGKEAEKTRIN